MAYKETTLFGRYGGIKKATNLTSLEHPNPFAANGPISGRFVQTMQTRVVVGP